MNKNEFLAQLRKGLFGLPQEEVEERVAFYGEMIDDRMEEGLSEAEAVSEILSMDEIGTKMIAKLPIDKGKKRGEKKEKTWEIVLLAVGSPIWFTLLLTVCVAALALYVALWSIVISLWSAFAVSIATAFACILATVIYFCLGRVLMGFAALGATSILFGVSIFLFYGGKAATKGSCLFPKMIFSILKKRLKKEKKDE